MRVSSTIKSDPPPRKRLRGNSKSQQNSDVAKAARAMAGAGLVVRGVEIDPATGRFVVLVGPPPVGEPGGYLKKEDGRKKREAETAV